MKNETLIDEQDICPAWLQAADGYEGWRVAVGLEVMEIAGEFSRQHRVDLDVAVISVFAAASYALGGAFQFDLPHERVAAPFSVLTITPDVSPIWAGIPLHFPREGLPEFFSHIYPLQAADNEGAKGDGNKLKEALDPELRFRHAEQALRDQLIDKMIATIYREDLNVPLARPPIDDHVTVGIPRRGLHRAVHQLSKGEKLLLEDALNGSAHGGRGNDNMACGRAAFFWTLHEPQARSFFRQNPWTADVPFVLMRTSQPEFPALDTGSSVCRTFEQVSRRLFSERLHTAVRPRIFRLPAECAKPMMEFLDKAQKQETAAGDKYVVSARQVMNLALKFTLVLMRLRDTTKLSVELIEPTLELAKYFGWTHTRNLSAYANALRAGDTETADLSSRERQAYLKIVEQKQAKRADLRKGFHEMSAAERDEIVVRLLAKGLIRQEGKYLMQNVA